jgi:hypothetical protein
MYSAVKHLIIMRFNKQDIQDELLCRGLVLEQLK